MATKIQPISGFPEYLPAQQLAFNRIVATIAHIYEGFGFAPVETAAVERIDMLVSKGIDSKEVYGLRRLNTAEGDDGAKDVALRFDLTVPMARYVAQNYANLVFPFRRYQVQPVWRGERPKEGRYRQFHQFDIDTLADGALPLTADAEILAAAHTALTAVLHGASTITMRVNNRRLLKGIIAWAGVPDAQQVPAIKIIDDIEKVSADETRKRLLALGGLETGVDKLLALLKSPTPEAALEAIVPQLNEEGQTGAKELLEVVILARTLVGKAAETSRIMLDFSIARGLDYYTGTVVETRLDAYPSFGSICSGGRYENLTASLSDRNLPGVGISIGISRLSSWLMQQAPYNAMGASSATLFLACQSAELVPQYAALAQTLRAQGVAVDMALLAQNLGTQLKNAAKKGIPYALMANAEDMAAGHGNLKNLQTGEQQTLAFAEIAAAVK
jgi:histidyl-tRNA synthetase